MTEGQRREETEGLQPTIAHRLRERRQGREALIVTDEVVHDGLEVLVESSALLIQRGWNQESHVHSSQLLDVSIRALGRSPATAAHDVFGRHACDHIIVRGAAVAERKRNEAEVTESKRSVPLK